MAILRAILNPTARGALSRLAWLRGRASVLAGVALLCLAGCMLADAIVGKKPAYAFSHQKHGSDLELSCTDCHGRAEEDEDPGMPRLAQCKICHAGIDAEKPPEHQVGTLFDGTTFRAAHAGRQSEEIVFSHKSHVARGIECAACHAEVARDEGMLGVRGQALRMSMDTCVACHAKTSGPKLDDCAACHSVIRAGVAPPSHQANWTRYHGSVVRAHSGERTDQCALCHKQSECTDCHHIELPASHNNYWRIRGHGLTASMDRKSCMTCHDSDSCDRCHEDVAPQSHAGGFGSPTDRHCLSCHEPLKSNTCFVCHKGTPSHDRATPLPPDHNPAMNCRMCHGNGQPLPHVDNGESCVNCHH